MRLAIVIYKDGKLDRAMALYPLQPPPPFASSWNCKVFHRSTSVFLVKYVVSYGKRKSKLGTVIFDKLSCVKANHKGGRGSVEGAVHRHRRGR